MSEKNKPLLSDEEIASLLEWKKMLEAAPGEAAEVIRERCLSSQYLQPIVAVWKSKLSEKDDLIRELVSALEFYANPVAATERRLKPGERINGAHMVRVADDLAPYADHAKAALSKAKEHLKA